MTFPALVGWLGMDPNDDRLARAERELAYCRELEASEAFRWFLGLLEGKRRECIEALAITEGARMPGPDEVTAIRARLGLLGEAVREKAGDGTCPRVVRWKGVHSKTLGIEPKA